MKVLYKFLTWLYRDSITYPNHAPRDRPLEVLALGVSQTGTESLREAFRELGYNDIYHGFECLYNPSSNAFWLDAMKAKFEGGKKYTREDWDVLFGNCRAITDIPAILFARELIEAYPEAKVILTTRDVDTWYNSVSNTFEVVVDSWGLRFMHHFHPLMFFLIGFFKSWDIFFRGSFKKNGKWVYEEHNAMIRGLVPKERLLEYHVSQGWGPLSEFLGKEKPIKEIPNGNLSSDFKTRVIKAQKIWLEEAKWNMIRFFSLSALFVAIMSGYVAKGTLFGALDVIRS